MEDDYYSTVYSWFDKCGIISNIRTHIRQNLVNALKNKDVGQKFGCNTPKSAKQYVYDLLIAEYLWNHNYAYTLSVFASEAPLLVNFNKHVSSNDNENNTRQKLQNDYVVHTLETLGIKPTKTNGQNIIKEYAENNVPLLLCILKQCKKTHDLFHESSYEESEFKNVRHQGVQTTETGESFDQEMSKMTAVKKKLILQKDLFDTQLKQKEIQLKEQTVIIEKQLVTLQDKLEQAQKVMQDYNLKEKKFNEDKKQERSRILQKEKELNMKEKLLTQEANRLEKEQDNYKQFENNMKKLQDELLKAKKAMPPLNTNCNSNVRSVEIQTDFESFVLARNERNFLSQEKQDLNGLVQEQQTRIDQLTNKVLYLSRKLEETQIKSPQNVQIPSSIIRVVNANTTVSDSSSTDDILQNARLRLKRLEEESIKADQRYLSFLTNSQQ